MNKLKPLARIAIHGVPRSGTSWVGEIFNSSPHTIYKFQPLFSYAFKDYLDNRSTVKDIHKFFQLISVSDDPFLDQVDKRKGGILPTFSKANSTHVVYKEVRYHNLLRLMLDKDSDLLAVLIVRNPLSVLGSWLAAPREFRVDLGWKVDDEWRYATKKNMGKPEEFYGYEKWKEAAELFLNLKDEFPGRVYLLRYENMINSPESEAAELFNFCGLPVNQQTLDFILSSRSLTIEDEYSVFRKKSELSIFKTNLDKKIVEYIENDLISTDLEGFLQ